MTIWDAIERWMLKQWEASGSPTSPSDLTREDILSTEYAWSTRLVNAAHATNPTTAIRADAELISELMEILTCAAAMTDAEKEEQRRSFAYGNTKLSNPDVTREMVDAPCSEPSCLKSNGHNGDHGLLPSEEAILKLEKPVPLRAGQPFSVKILDVDVEKYYGIKKR